jgi:hypothetical protein
MNEYDIKRLARVYSIQAEIEAMKAENSKRPFEDKAPIYGYDHFIEKAKELGELGFCHNEQL